MKYAIIDQDGDCVDKGFHTLDTAIIQAKSFILKELHFATDEYQLYIHPIHTDNTINQEVVATVSLGLIWNVEKTS